MTKKWSKRWVNPVFIQESQWRIRKKTTPWILFFHLLLMGIIVFFALFVFIAIEPFFDLRSGTNIFIIFSYLQLGMVVFISPAIASGLISAEREKQTLSLLLVTPLSSKQIILGKWLSSVGFMLLLYLSTLPVYVVIYNYGGISLDQALRVFLHLLITMLFLSSVGIFFSSLVKRTGISIILSYLVVIIWGIVSTFIFYLVSVFTSVINNVPINEIPFFWELFISLHPAASMAFVLDIEIAAALLNMHNMTFPVYILYFVIYTILTIFLLISSAYFLSPKRDQQKE